MGETAAHVRLKRIAVEALIRAGCVAVGLEVRCPFSRYRFDCAGYLDSRFVEGKQVRAEAQQLDGTLWSSSSEGARVLADAQRRESCEPRTVVVECKQERSDFLRDGEAKDSLLRDREGLEQRAREIEEGYIKEQEPHLQDSNVFLFGEMESWDFTSSESKAYRRVLRDLRRVEEQLHGNTKFWLAVRYRLADRLYVLAPAGMVGVRELPSGWGLLEYPDGALRRKAFDAREACDDVRIAREGPEHGSREQLRQRLLRNIAVAATREAMRRFSE